MITTFNEYVDAALRTESLERDGQWQAHIPDRTYRANHGFTGLVTELGELAHALLAIDIDWVNVQEECSDLWWYIAILVDEFYGGDRPELRLLGLDEVPKVSQYVQMAYVHSTMFELMADIGGGMDVIKRRIQYNAGDDDDKAAWANISNLYLPGIIDQLLTLHAQLRIDVRETWSKNIDKLRKRYPGKFTAFAALNRDEAAERAVLEGET